MARLRSTVWVLKHSADLKYTDTSYSRLQAAGFMERHGFAVSMAGDSDVPDEDNTSGARSEDLSSPGSFVPVSQADIRQTSNAADKAARESSNCVHGVISKRVDGTVLCHGCRKTWPDYKSFEAEQERRRAAGGSNATDKSNQAHYAPLSKSAAALSHHKATKSTGAFDHSDDSLRDELSQKLYKAAGTETNRERRNAIERFAQAIDSGALPIPRNFAVRMGAVRLSTGKRIGGSGRHGWHHRHGFA